MMMEKGSTESGKWEKKEMQKGVIHERNSASHSDAILFFLRFFVAKALKKGSRGCESAGVWALEGFS